MNMLFVNKKLLGSDESLGQTLQCTSFAKNMPWHLWFPKIPWHVFSHKYYTREYCLRKLNCSLPQGRQVRVDIKYTGNLFVQRRLKIQRGQDKQEQKKIEEQPQSTHKAGSFLVQERCRGIERERKRERERRRRRLFKTSKPRAFTKLGAFLFKSGEVKEEGRARTAAGGKKMLDQLPIEILVLVIEFIPLLDALEALAAVNRRCRGLVLKYGYKNKTRLHLEGVWHHGALRERGGTRHLAIPYLHRRSWTSILDKLPNLSTLYLTSGPRLFISSPSGCHKVDYEREYLYNCYLHQVHGSPMTSCPTCIRDDLDKAKERTAFALRSLSQCRITKLGLAGEFAMAFETSLIIDYFSDNLTELHIVFAHDYHFGQTPNDGFYGQYSLEFENMQAVCICVNLRKLNLNFAHTPRYLNNPNHLFNNFSDLQKLEHFILSDERNNFAFYIIPQLSSPSLKQIEIYGGFWYSSHRPTALFDNFVPSCLLLEELTFGGDFPSNLGGHILTDFPNIKKISCNFKTYLSIVRFVYTLLVSMDEQRIARHILVVNNCNRLFHSWADYDQASSEMDNMFDFEIRSPAYLFICYKAWMQHLEKADIWHIRYQNLSIDVLLTYRPLTIQSNWYDLQNPNEPSWVQI